MSHQNRAPICDRPMNRACASHQSRIGDAFALGCDDASVPKQERNVKWRTQSEIVS